MTQQTHSNSYETSLKKRVESDLWTRIEQASTLGDSILKAQEHRDVGQILTPDQIRALASATGVIPEYSPTTALKGESFFPQGNLPEETLHKLSDDWRHSRVKFARTIPSSFIQNAQLQQLGITQAPDYYQRNAG